MQDGTKRVAVSWKLSVAFSWWLLVILNVFVCNMLLKNVRKNHKNNILEKLTKNAPTWSQNLSKIDPGGALEASWEPLLKQGASEALTILAPFGDPLWDQFGLILDIFLFLMFFWSAFLMALASIWAPKTPPKWAPKGGQHQNLKIIEFECIYNTWTTFQGAENHIFSMFLLNPILGWLLEPILVILAHFWDPFWRQFCSLFGYHFCIDF